MCCSIGGGIHLLPAYQSRLVPPPYLLASHHAYPHLLQGRMPFRRRQRRVKYPTIRAHHQQPERSLHRCHRLWRSLMHQCGKPTSKPLTDDRSTPGVSLICYSRVFQIADRSACFPLPYCDQVYFMVCLFVRLFFVTLVVTLVVLSWRAEVPVFMKFGTDVEHLCQISPVNFSEVKVAVQSQSRYTGNVALVMLGHGLRYLHQIWHSSQQLWHEIWLNDKIQRCRPGVWVLLVNFNQWMKSCTALGIHSTDSYRCVEKLCI